MTSRLILFTRFPRPGSAKTRLIPLLGKEGAADLHRELTEHTLRAVDQSAARAPLDVQIQFTGASPEEMADWLGAHRVCVEQSAGDLGTRMDVAVQDAFSQSIGRVVVIGADCPDLSPEIITRSFDLLMGTDIVLGPALDGGYYLVGIRQSAWERSRRLLFANMPWGTDEVLTETVRRAHKASLDLAQLDLLGDVDRPQDLAVWQRARPKKS